jgi:hypothetical protein
MEFPLHNKPLYSTGPTIKMENPFVKKKMNVFHTKLTQTGGSKRVKNRLRETGKQTEL